MTKKEVLKKVKEALDQSEGKDLNFIFAYQTEIKDIHRMVYGNYVACLGLTKLIDKEIYDAIGGCDNE